MRKLMCVAITLAAVLALLSPLSPGGDAAAAVWISELIADPVADWNGDGIWDAQGDEWIEVMNDGSTSVNLDYFYVCDAYGDEAQLKLFGNLAPGEARVFYGSDAVAWQQQSGMSLTGLSLNNTGDTVKLYVGNPAGSYADMVDAVIFDSHSVADDRSCGKLALQGELMLFDGLNPYTGSLVPCGSGCDPSPGSPNTCAEALPAEPASWGTVKSLYDR